MDNVTHSLLGVLIGAASARHVGSLRGALWAAIVGSNLPDLDLLLQPFYDEPKLGYLLHHRGHSHTLLALPFLAVVGWAIARNRAPEGRKLYALTLGSALLHLVADSWNNYGVHPFWPVDNRWFYGDMVFIVEPWLWVALLPLAWTLAGRAARGLVLLLALTSVGLVGAVVGLDIAGALCAALVLGHRLAARGHGMAWALGGIAVTLSAGALGSRIAARAVVDLLPAREEVVDVSRSPLPGAPWCWDVWVATVDDGTWRVRNARVALLPGLRAPDRCALRDAQRTAPTRPPDLTSTVAVAWQPQFEAPLAELRSRTAGACRADAFLGYSRLPYWAGEVIGDLRYDMEPELGFAEIEAAPGDPRGCRNAPPWRGAPAGLLVE